MKRPVHSSTLAATAALLRSGGLEPAVGWVSARPLWAAEEGQALRRPALLTFTEDSFMESLLALLAQQPEGLFAHVAKKRSYREPPPAALGLSPALPTRLKLYQPLHGHFNLVSASLICRRSGLPDRRLAGAESVGFVLRRLDAQGQELAWVSSEAGKQWQTLAPHDVTKRARNSAGLPAEEIFPMFPLEYCHKGEKRRVWAGLVPTSSQETFKRGELSPLLAADSPEVQSERLKLGLPDPRLLEVRTRVIYRIDELKAQTEPLSPQEREATLFLLLDLAEFLAEQGKLTVILSDSAPAAGEAVRQLYDTLEGSYLNPLQASQTWRAALKEVWSQRQAIYEGTLDPGSLAYNLRNTTLDPNLLSAHLLSALGPYDAPTAPAASAGVIPKLEGGLPGQPPRYLLRCVFLRPGCPEAELLSEPSEAFEIAAVFDADAPARPVHISLPLDTSIAGLRKFKKNVSFALSKGLRQQMERVSNPKGVLNGDLGAAKDFDLGVLCSFSLPIITLCAFLVLMVFLTLLNIVFWWLPFFRICLPMKR